MGNFSHPLGSPLFNTPAACTNLRRAASYVTQYSLPPEIAMLLLSTDETPAPHVSVAQPRAHFPADDVRFGLAMTAPELEAARELRRQAYSADGKLVGAHNAGCPDEFDGRSSIILAKVDAAYVATVRIFASTPDQRLSASRGFEILPEVLRCPQHIVEASRFAIHPAARGRGLLWPMAARMVLAAAATRRAYLVASATEGLLRVWQECGFRETGDTYANPDFGGMRHHLMIMSIAEVTAGRGISPRFSGTLATAIRQWPLEFPSLPGGRA